MSFFHNKFNYTSFTIRWCIYDVYDGTHDAIISKNQRKLFGALSLVNIGLRYMGDDQTLDKMVSIFI